MERTKRYKFDLGRNIHVPLQLVCPFLKMYQQAPSAFRHMVNGVEMVIHKGTPEAFVLNRMYNPNIKGLDSWMVNSVSDKNAKLIIWKNKV